jgi:Putative Flp pilus-assembly TadE/G-like
MIGYSTKSSTRVWQQGQAMIFALVFTAAAGLMSLLLFNSGLLANTKTRLQNAADAAAYSASVLQARDHNFSAYTNRAMVANQVAVAQIVSLKSFIEDAKATGDRMGEALLTFERQVFPTSAPIWDNTLNNTVPAVSLLNQGFASSASDLVTGLDQLIDLHMKAQDLHHGATAIDMMLVATEVIQKNDALAQMSNGNFSVGNLTMQVNDWQSYTKQHSANDSSAEADRFADVVVSENTTDSFIRNRGSVPVPSWLSGPANGVQPATCLLNQPANSVAYTGMSTTWFNFYHAGGTILSSDKKKWEALDATQGSGGWFCIYSTCTYYVGISVIVLPTCTNGGPLIDIGGSGGGLAGNGSDYGDSSGYKNNPNTSVHYGWALYSPAALPANIRYGDGPGSSLDSNGGLQNYYRDINDPTTKTPKNQTPEENGGAAPITIEVERPANTLRTASNFLPNSNIIRLDDQLASNTMRAMASAHAYFYRSKTDDGFTRSGWARNPYKKEDEKAELENLFSPYWQSRLTDISIPERNGSQQEQMN